MDIRGLEIFLAVCETGGLTSAARSLSVTQAAVSQHLSKLERELGLLLVDRSVRPPRPTVAGEFLRRRARKLFGEIDDIEKGLKRYRDSDIPELKIGIIESVAAALLPHLVQRLAGKVGNLSITSGTTHPLLPELIRGDIDMIITTEQVDGVEGAESIGLLTEPVVLCLPRDRAAPADWDDMTALANSLDMIRYGPKRRLSHVVERQLERFGIETHGTLEFDSSFAVFDQVRNGLGWTATTPLCLYCAGVDASEVTIAPFPSATPIRCINIAWMPERGGAAAQLVAQTCRTIFSEIVIPELCKRSGVVADRVRLVA
ncbi:MAG: LysR family transcriptional regulator [Beijerinckiaceae bacterium]|nr:LysR family transcriptional regulator [Beijerinckiaceae bacterium]MDO9440167.1 LysR family transcriptional regulator [Beijerinckiaceae bacterium]